MFRFKSAGPTSSDCTTPYTIELDKEYTVREFIETVLKEKPDEWGYIGIDREDKSIFGDPRIEYSYGKMLYNMPSEYLDQKIHSAKARGGWTNMDYQLKLYRVDDPGFTLITDHYGYKHEDIYGYDLYHVYEYSKNSNGMITYDDRDGGKGKFRNVLTAINECKYLEKQRKGEKEND